MKTRYLIPLTLLSAVVCLNAIRSETRATNPESKPETAPSHSLSDLTLPFVRDESLGNSQVRYVARTLGGSASVFGDGTIRYTFRGVRDDNHVVFHIEERFASSGAAEIRAGEEAVTRLHRFEGRGSGIRKTSLPTYRSVEYQNAFPGIDLSVQARMNNIEKFFIIRPSGNPDDICVRVHRADDLGVNQQGELEIATTGGVIRFTKPVAYQERGGGRTNIDVAYRVQDDAYGFTVGEYDKTRPLIIDPLLASTFLGGEEEEIGYAIALDSEENVFVAGGTTSPDFPFRADGSDWTDWDVFVAKFDRDLTILQSMAILDGAEDERAYTILIDETGDVVISGSTASADFPTEAGAFSEEHAGFFDAFIVKLDNDLSSVLASTLIGGENYDGFYALAQDGNGNIYASGLTYSPEFPVTDNGYDRTYTATGPEWLPGDAVVSRFDHNLTILQASTFLGAEGFDWGLDIAWHDGSVFVGGETKAPPTIPSANKMSSIGEPMVDPYIQRKNSSLKASRQEFPYKSDAQRLSVSSFPVTPAAFDETHNGDTDVFITRLDDRLEKLEASTFVGGRRADLLGGLEFDRHGRLVVGGSTLSPDFPTTPEAYDPTYNGFFDAFILKLDATLGTLEAATFYGGAESDVSESFTIKGNGYIYIAGYTTSSDLPIPAGSQDSTHTEPGVADIFVARFDNDLRRIATATLLGGDEHQDCLGIAINWGSHVYITGTTRSQDFPITQGGYDSIYNGGTSDVYVLKIDRYLSEEENRFWNTQRLLVYPPYPNPFHGRTAIRLDLPDPSPLTVTIHDMKGKRVFEFDTPGTWEPGLYEFYWEGIDVAGFKVPSGQYLCRVRTNDFDDSRKLILLPE